MFVSVYRLQMVWDTCVKFQDLNCHLILTQLGDLE